MRERVKGIKKIISKVRVFFFSIKMANKLSILLTMIVLLSLTVVSWLSWVLYTRDVEKVTESLFMQIAISFEAAMDNTINNLNAIAKAPLYSKNMQEELSVDQILSNESIAEMRYSLDMVSPTERLQYVIVLYSISGKVAFSSTTSSMAYVIRQYYDTWYEAAEKENGDICITGFPDTEHNFVCAVSRVIKSIPQMENVGMVSISVPRSVFDEACRQIQNIDGGVAVIFDVNGQVIYTSSDCNDERTTVEAFYHNAKQAGEKDARFDMDGYIGYYSTSNSGNYSVLVYTTHEELLANQIRIKRGMGAFLIFVCGVTVITVYLVTSSTTKPLSKAVALMIRVQNGDWSVRFRPRYHDEIGILGENFDRMLEKVDEMTKQLIDINVSKRQAEIDALRSQINPHFMYNTLESFRMMAVEKDDFELADLICSFGKMLRYNITTMNELTTIRYEIEYLDHYIRIQNSRNPRHISISYHVPEEMLDLHIIKLLIQPIVENAVLHGLEMKLIRERKISITAYRINELCCIDIRDNGFGMEPEKLEQLRRNICMRYTEVTESTHIGMRNVNERIHLYYGIDYGLSIDSIENEGTIVRISLPYRAMKGGQDHVEDCNCR